MGGVAEAKARGSKTDRVLQLVKLPDRRAQVQGFDEVHRLTFFGRDCERDGQSEQRLGRVGDAPRHPLMSSV